MEEFLKKKTAGTNLKSEIEPVEVSKDEEAAGVTSQDPGVLITYAVWN